MNNLPTKTKQSVKEDYNNIPVHYCRECLSLKVMRVAGMDDTSYCDDCGCTDIVETDIDTWEAIYKQKHGFTYLNNNY